MNKVTEINCETGEIVERDLTTEELDALLQSQNEEQQQIALKQSAIEKFRKLGLTDDEISVMLPQA
jgi:hypothetical protein